jgi:sugar phosphate isomerase/epimerase
MRALIALSQSRQSTRGKYVNSSMKNSTRRRFLQNTGLSVAATFATSSLFARNLFNEKIGSIGLQVWSIAKMMQDDTEKALGLLQQNGYSEVELYGPYPFSSDADQERWKAITPLIGFSGSGYFGRTAKEFRDLLSRYKLTTPAMHAGLDTLRAKMAETAAAANELGQKYVGIASIPEEERKTIDDYKRIADDFNTIGENAKKHGIRFYYHNHGYGLKEVNGQVPFDIIVERTDPSLVFFEMDIFWTTAGGADGGNYLEKHPGRFKLMHVKDMKKKVHFSGDGSNPQQWIELFPYITDAGQGVLDLKGILSKAKKSGVDHFILENDVMTNPSESLKKGASFMKSVEI